MISLFAKKSLGQNFLKNPVVIADIVAAANITAGDLIVEVGPGTGALTEALLEACIKVGNGARLIAIEKDARLIAPLKEKFADALNAGTFTLHEDDVLTLKSEVLTPDQRPYKIIANIPYYITGAFFRKFLAEEKHKPSDIVVMVQKEVADRIMAHDGKESLLSISVKAYGTPTYVRTVVRGNFNPMPDVDSAVIAIHSIHSPWHDAASDDFFWRILHAGFAHKRKQLLGNLLSAGIGEKNNLEAWLSRAHIAPTARAEDLSIQDWLTFLATKEG